MIDEKQILAYFSRFTPAVNEPTISALIAKITHPH